jgi:hypothetical protein
VAAAEAVEKYQPQDKGRVDDLGRPAADLLRQLPGVVNVEVVPADGKPARRLIHLRDFHFVPRALFALELRGQGLMGCRPEDAGWLPPKWSLNVVPVSLSWPCLKLWFDWAETHIELEAQGWTSCPVQTKVLTAFRRAGGLLSTLTKSCSIARQRADYQKHPHKRIGLPLVDQVEKGSMAAAVRLMCLDCSGWVKPEIRDCVIIACPLYPFRPYQGIRQRNPNDPPQKPAPDTTAEAQTGDRPAAGPDVA